MHTLDHSRPQIDVTRAQIAPDCAFGDDVRIEAEELIVGPGCKIGFSGSDDFRTYGGVRIKARRLELGAGTVIGRAVKIDGGAITLDEGVRVARYVTINVNERLHVGAYGTIGESSEISGRDVRIGQELWMLPNVKIGGGSAFECDSQLEAGDYLHLGVHTFINTARPVRIGNEVGMGTRTAIYTHGAYPSRLMGFPVAFDEVEIGDFAWIPGAVINPGVHIGANCVIGVNSLVTRDIPAGALAGGSPAKVLRENCFPQPLSTDAQLEFFEEFLAHYARMLRIDARPVRRDGIGTILLDAGSAVYIAAPRIDDAVLDASAKGRRLLAIGGGDEGSSHERGWTIFDTNAKRIAGMADAQSGRLVNELRRYGIRFYSRDRDGTYQDW